jgi:hypothetical protein
VVAPGWRRRLRRLLPIPLTRGRRAGSIGRRGGRDEDTGQSRHLRVLRLAAVAGAGQQDRCPERQRQGRRVPTGLRPGAYRHVVVERSREAPRQLSPQKGGHRRGDPGACRAAARGDGDEVGAGAGDPRRRFRVGAGAGPAGQDRGDSRRAAQLGSGHLPVRGRRATRGGDGADQPRGHQATAREHASPRPAAAERAGRSGADDGVHRRRAGTRYRRHAGGRRARPGRGPGPRASRRAGGRRRTCGRAPAGRAVGALRRHDPDAERLPPVGPLCSGPAAERCGGGVLPGEHGGQRPGGGRRGDRQADPLHPDPRAAATAPRAGRGGARTDCAAARAGGGASGRRSAATALRGRAGQAAAGAGGGAAAAAAGGGRGEAPPGPRRACLPIR